MDPKRWQQIKEVIDTVAEAPAEQRREILDETCLGDPELRREVEAFLQLDDDDLEGFLEEPLWRLSDDADKKNLVLDRRIGPYRVEKLLGRGGMGSVYLAIREDDFTQRVALKLVHQSMAREDILARFVNERQILANLDHPGIAHLLDGGTTEDGLPYFAMEYVEGEPIDRYCAAHDLSVRDRLELFGQVCDAVRFAHRNLVVHRDLKPSNILITEDGSLKLLDFGIAKLLGDRPSAAVTALNSHGPMTPRYASPEQLLQDPITTATDVYTLGVLLYRLISGRHPYELDGSQPQMVQAICLKDPPRPSQAVLTMPAEDHDATRPDRDAATTSPPPTKAPPDRWLARQLAGDLDAIVMKAMRKEPEHRYGSVAELSEDVRRHLVGLPVEARQGTWTYHAAKFVRRNKAPLAVVGLILALILGFGLALQRQLDETRVERDRAQRMVELFEQIFTAANPSSAKGEDLTAKEFLDYGRDYILDLEEEPRIKADLLDTVGRVYSNLRALNEAREVFQEAVRIEHEISGGASLQLAEDLQNLAKVHYDLGEYHEAETTARDALKLLRRFSGDDDLTVARLLNTLGAILERQGQPEAAAEAYEESLRIRRGQLPRAHRDITNSLNNLGTLLLRLGKYDEAEKLFVETLELRRELFGPETPAVARTLQNLGRTQVERGRYKEAEGHLLLAVEILKKLHEEDNVSVAHAQRNLAFLYLRQDRAENCAALAREVAAKLQEAYSSKSHWSLSHTSAILGGCLARLGRFQEAEALLVEAYEALLAELGAGPIHTRDALGELRALYERTGQNAKLDALPNP